MILEALRLGVRYCDTAPAYQQSQDYYGEAFRAAGPQARDGVFLASKTHERTRDAALRLLDDSLRRLATDRLDLWQMHDLRDMRELDVMCGAGGALEAAARGAARRPRPLHRPHRPSRSGRAGRGDAALPVRQPAGVDQPGRSALPPVPADRRRRGAAPGHGRRRHEGAGGGTPGARGAGAGSDPLRGRARRHGDRRLLQRRRGARQLRGQRRASCRWRQTNGAPSNRRSRRAPICTTPSRADRGRNRSQPRDRHSDFRYSTRSPFSAAVRPSFMNES